MILDDRYRLDEPIAAGGVGQVWRATDLLLERPVAVKVLRPEYSDHPETLERFRKEAKNAGALSNPHVAQVYDYGPSGPGGSPYLVMEFVDGPSLADLLAVDPIPPARALDVIAQAAQGLAAAHKAGVIHRDIKPGNILISNEGRVKVTDFGIAHAAGQVPVTGPGLVMGTTQYMAPERIAGDPGTAASDLYALGIVLHECLTGVPPHDGTAAEVMAAHLYLPLPPLPANVPAELDVLVDRLTAKDPARRISDGRELADLAARLRDLINGPLVPAARTTAQSGPGAAFPSPVPQAVALAAQSPASWPGGYPGGDQADGASRGRDITANTALLAPPGRLDEALLRLGRVECAAAHVAAHGFPRSGAAGPVAGEPAAGRRDRGRCRRRDECRPCRAAGLRRVHRHDRREPVAGRVPGDRQSGREPGPVAERVGSIPPVRARRRCGQPEHRCDTQRDQPDGQVAWQEVGGARPVGASKDQPDLRRRHVRHTEWRRIERGAVKRAADHPGRHVKHPAERVTVPVLRPNLPLTGRPPARSPRQ